MIVERGRRNIATAYPSCNLIPIKTPDLRRPSLSGAHYKKLIEKFHGLTSGHCLGHRAVVDARLALPLRTSPQQSRPAPLLCGDDGKRSGRMISCINWMQSSQAFEWCPVIGPEPCLWNRGGVLIFVKVML